MDLRTIELDVQDEASDRRQVDTTARAHGRIEVLVHDAGRTVWGPAEASTPKQLAEL